MRTLLNEVLPPLCAGAPAFSRTEQKKPAQRTFSRDPVLTTLDDLVEVVVVDGTVTTTPSAGAEEAEPALVRDVAASKAQPVQSDRAAHSGSKPDLREEATPAV